LTPAVEGNLLDEKVAVVTGGAAGIGGGVSRRLAGEGATVVINDIDEELLTATVREIGRSDGPDAIAVPGDIRA